MAQLTQAQQDLRDAVERLYVVFAPYPLGEVQGCPCCVSWSDQSDLRARPLPALTRKQLQHYSDKAMTTWGGVEDFKHFLPRLLELLVEDSFFGGLETFAYKLDRADFAYWPLEERQAIEACCRAWWRTLLATFPTWDRLETYLALFAHVLNDIRPLLEELGASDELATQRHLVRLSLDLSDAYAGLSLARRGWGDGKRSWGWVVCPDQTNQVADWMLEPATALQLGLAIEALEASGYGSDLRGETWLKEMALYLMGPV
jgi:hypothetical protein